MNFLVATKSARVAKKNNAQYATADDAFLPAKVLLEGETLSVWIINTNGDLILPADQVRLRLRETDTDAGRSRT